jgi:hypothetical protein
MPAPSFFKEKPKTDRRLEWKQLKAKHAAAITKAKVNVEVGLGKALDNYQKEVDAIVKLDGAQITEASFAPVLASAAAVKKHIVTLVPKAKAVEKVSNTTNFSDYFDALKRDCDWWAKAAKEVKQAPGYVDKYDRQRVVDAVDKLTALKGPVVKLDALLVGAAKKNAPSEVSAWQKASRALQPHLAKLELLNKNPTGNHKLLIGQLRDMEAAVGEVRTRALHMTSIVDKKYAAVADWKAVEDEAQKAVNLAHDARNNISSLR